MKFATDKSHRDYFYKHGFIEFDGLFSNQQVQEIQNTIQEIQCKRMDLRKGQLALEESNKIFMQSHDLWRDSEFLKKLFLSRKLAEIAGELTETYSLRYGSDQLLLGERQGYQSESVTSYQTYLKSTGSLEEKSCFRPTVCGLMICLDPIFTENEAPLFSKKEGSAIFFKSDLQMDLSNLMEKNSGRYILITYVDPRTVYILNENDPHTHSLKHQGYVFGDRLSEALNPLVLR